MYGHSLNYIEKIIIIKKMLMISNLGYYHKKITEYSDKNS